MRDMENMVVLHILNTRYTKSKNIIEKWGCIRQAYMNMMPYIIEQSKKNKNIGIDPYILNWKFSQIEYEAWSSIRYYGIVMYPQFPVFNYFIDFANPYLRIGLELDGKDYHDKEKDESRDKELSIYGWKIFRIKGSECYKKFNNDVFFNEDCSEDDVYNWIMNTSDGVIYSLDIIYFDGNNKHKELAYECLNKHRLTNFKI